MPSEPKYRRIVLKLSGEALREPGSKDNISPQIVNQMALEIKEVQSLGVQVAVVIGGGNIWRGLAASHRGMNRTTADYMGMLATVINGMALMSGLEDIGLTTRVQTSIEMNNVAEPFILRRALHQLEKGHVVIFVAGTGNPVLSTDTTAALRGTEIGAEVLLKGTQVDGIYDKDPNKHADAVRYESLSFMDVLSKELEVMDSTAIALCKDNAIPIVVFDLFGSGNIGRAVRGEPIGTSILPSA